MNNQFKVRKKFAIITSIFISIISILLFFIFIEIPTSKVDTSDWKTYRNEEYGFEFKYPENRKIIEEKDSSLVSVDGFRIRVSDNNKIHECWKNYVFLEWKIFNLYETCDGVLANRETLVLHSKDKTYIVIPPLGDGDKINRDILSTLEFIN